MDSLVGMRGDFDSKGPGFNSHQIQLFSEVLKIEFAAVHALMVVHTAVCC